MFKSIIGVLLGTITLAKHSEKVQAALDHMSDDFQNTRFTTGDEQYAHELSHLALHMEEHVIEGGVYNTYGSSVFLYDNVKLVP